MPRLPGREPIKTKIAIEKLAISGFFMPWESQYAKRECVVGGCDHRIGNCMEIGGGPGMAVDLTQYERDREKGTMRADSGPACSCCTTKILASGE